MFRPASTLRQLLLAAATVLSAAAQQQIQAPSLDGNRHFQAASIRPGRPGATTQDMRIAFPGSRLEATSITLVEFLNLAYPHPGMKFRNGPDWMDSQRFDIVGQANPAEGEITSTQRLEMMRTLVQERFKLAFHLEKDDVQGLALVAGKPPLRLTRAKADEPAGNRTDAGRTVFRNSGVSALAFTLSSLMGIPVEDRSGITGKFDFFLDPGRFVTAPPDAAPAPEPIVPGSSADRVRLAVEDLGLRLEPAKATIFTVVVEHVERPGT